MLGQRVAEGHKEHQAQLVSLVLLGELAHQVHLVLLDQLGLLAFLEKKDHQAYGEITDLKDVRVREELLALLAA